MDETWIENLLTEQPPSVCTNISLVSLNFKVPLRVRLQFKIYAARHNMTMTDLLLQLLEDCMASDTQSGELPRSQSKR